MEEAGPRGPGPSLSLCYNQAGTLGRFESSEKDYVCVFLSAQLVLLGSPLTEVGLNEQRREWTPSGGT